MPSLVRPAGEPMVAMRGHGKVEIFDERTGSLVQQEPFENFITVETKKYMKWMARKTFWAGMAGSIDERSGFRAAGDPSANYAEAGPWFPSVAPLTDTSPHYNLSHLAISTDTSAEDPTNEEYLQGQIVAWANKATYVGTDTRRGSQNLTEDFADATTAKWVFDWPTNAGNGTFQSVAWVSLNETDPVGTIGPLPTLYREASYTPPVFGQAGTPYLGTNYSGQIQYDYKADSDDANDRLIVSQYDSGSPFHRRIWAASYDLSTWTQLFDKNGLGLPDGPIAVAGSSIYHATYDRSTNPCLIKTSFTGTITSTVASTWTTLLGLSSSEQVWDMAYDGTNLWVSIGQNNTTRKVFKINPTTGAVITTLDLSAYMVAGEGLGFIAVDPSGDLWVGSLYTIAKFSTAGVFKAKFTGYSNEYNWYSFLWRNSGGVSALYGAHYSGPLSLSKISFKNLGARTLLGAPVTKSNTQTMKVTYEFDFS